MQNWGDSYARVSLIKRKSKKPKQTNKKNGFCSCKKHSIMTHSFFFSLIEKVSRGKHFSTAKQTEKQEGSQHVLHRSEVTVACQRGMMHRTYKGRTNTVSCCCSWRSINMTEERWMGWWQKALFAPYFPDYNFFFFFYFTLNRAVYSAVQLFFKNFQALVGTFGTKCKNENGGNLGAKKKALGLLLPLCAAKCYGQQFQFVGTKQAMAG